MQAIDHKGRLALILLDPARKIPESHLTTTCKKGQGHFTCRYIALAANGFVCVKNSSLAVSLDKQVGKNQFTAKGNNCEGLGQHGKEAKAEGEAGGKHENEEPSND